MNERWLPIPGYEGVYEVSDLGRVRSLDRVDRFGRQLRGRILKQRRDKDGYRQFHAGGSPRRMLRVHRLVLLAFRGVPPEGCAEVLHVDGDPANNKLTNLHWGTSDEANTYVHPETGNRACRSCARERSRLRTATRSQKAA